ncbi:hypothetical protein [Grimontia marina]|uniref:Uncharacterized protein n=1 Tax=Grimontia marina TaxID=646534 RepID=A0A128FC07_9GAMM|nr:hypothetical protein [Grimontia marina]CZF84035.1 hypothetical protein GMA8713_02918 [Grimontia marina]
MDINDALTKNGNPGKHCAFSYPTQHIFCARTELSLSALQMTDGGFWGRL